MRKSNQQSIGEALQQFLKENHIDKKLHQADIIGKWEILVGKLFAKHTKQVYFMGSKLVIELDSPALRNEMNMLRTNLIAKINEMADDKVVTEIILK